MRELPLAVSKYRLRFSLSYMQPEESGRRQGKYWTFYLRDMWCVMNLTICIISNILHVFALPQERGRGASEEGRGGEGAAKAGGRETEAWGRGKAEERGRGKETGRGGEATDWAAEVCLLKNDTFPLSTIVSTPISCVFTALLFSPDNR